MYKIGIYCKTLASQRAKASAQKNKVPFLSTSKNPKARNIAIKNNLKKGYLVLCFQTEPPFRLFFGIFASNDSFVAILFNRTHGIFLQKKYILNVPQSFLVMASYISTFLVRYGNKDCPVM